MQLYVKCNIFCLGKSSSVKGIKFYDDVSKNKEASRTLKNALWVEKIRLCRACVKFEPIGSKYENVASLLKSELLSVEAVHINC